MNAVLGIEQMKRIDSNVQKRINNLKVWLENLDSEKFITDFDLDGNSNFALPLILSKENGTFLKKVCEVLNEEKVEFRLGTAGGGNQSIQPHLEKFTFKVSGGLDVMNFVHSNSLYIGNHTDLTDEQIINLCKKLNNV
jgi:CDP-6-deoxy-D-xylo-4-hexulose-3-dehydrase